MDGDMEEGAKLLREALRLDPDGEGAKVALKQCRFVQTTLQEARRGVFHRNFAAAVDLFQKILDDVRPLPPRSHLYCLCHSEKSHAHLRLKQHSLALKHSATALASRDDLEPAWLVRAQALGALERHTEAADALAGPLATWGSDRPALRDAHAQAVFEVRQAQRPDYYALLGSPRVASEREIRRLYKEKARELHPDRWSGGSEEEKKSAEEGFRLLGEGVEVLTDEFRRGLYDQGHDLASINERVAAAQQEAKRAQGKYRPHGHH
uniref:J domain-containing protein n=1 Tax=Corethron hystrix TaxID=216773 RepID=A0A7S1FQ45_9STRA